MGDTPKPGETLKDSLMFVMCRLTEVRFDASAPPKDARRVTKVEGAVKDIRDGIVIAEVGVTTASPTFQAKCDVMQVLGDKTLTLDDLSAPAALEDVVRPGLKTLSLLLAHLTREAFGEPTTIQLSLTDLGEGDEDDASQ